MFLMNFLLLPTLVNFVLSFAKQTESLDRNDSHGGVHEYCLKEENFEARCLKHEVIVPISAAYGRMRIGRCLESEGHQLLTAIGNDPLFLGCSVDVLPLLHSKCFGRNHCEIRGQNDPSLKLERPCHAALQNYLEVDYQCVTVIEEDRSCLVTLTSNPLHIMLSSSSSPKLSCGTKSQPWRLEAPAGQQINVSLLDFGHPPTRNVEEKGCVKYGYIIEKSSKKNVSICGTGLVNDNIVFKSSTNALEIVIVASDSSQDSRDEMATFLLRLTAVGCSNVIPPEDTWMKRSEHEAVIGCYSSRQTWNLHCRENRWIGVVGNCTRELAASILPMAEVRKYDDYQLVVIVAVGFLALVICLIIICCGAVCLRRYYSSVARKWSHKTEEFEKVKCLETMSNNHANNTMMLPTDISHS